MVKSETLALLGMMGVGGYLLFSRNVEASLDNWQQPTIITVPGYRVNGVVDVQDVGTTKILPIVNTSKTSTTRDPSMSRSAKTADIIKYNESPTAIDKIRNAVKVLPKNKSDELKSNLEKLGWA